MAARQAPQAFSGIVEAGDGRAAEREVLAHAALEDRDEQIVLALEVEIHGAGGDAGGAGDVGDLRVEIAAVGEDVDGGAQDGVALGAGRRIASGDGGESH